MALRPDFVDAQSNIGASLQDLGDIKGAVDAFAKSVAIRHDSRPGTGISALRCFCKAISFGAGPNMNGGSELIGFTPAKFSAAALEWRLSPGSRF